MFESSVNHLYCAEATRCSSNASKRLAGSVYLSDQVMSRRLNCGCFTSIRADSRQVVKSNWVVESRSYACACDVPRTRRATGVRDLHCDAQEIVGLKFGKAGLPSPSSCATHREACLREKELTRVPVVSRRIFGFKPCSSCSSGTKALDRLLWSEAFLGLGILAGRKSLRGVRTHPATRWVPSHSGCSRMYSLGFASVSGFAWMGRCNSDGRCIVTMSYGWSCLDPHAVGMGFWFWWLDESSLTSGRIFDSNSQRPCQCKCPHWWCLVSYISARGMLLSSTPQ